MQTRELGPLVVMWLDDGSVWGYGNPPLRVLVRVDTFAGPLRLKGFARCCERINGCMTRPELDALAHALEIAHHDSPYWPHLQQWLAHRADMLARGQLIQPLGWGDPRRLKRE